jgi:hypothetical protein
MPEPINTPDEQLEKLIGSIESTGASIKLASEDVRAGVEGALFGSDPLPENCPSRASAAESAMHRLKKYVEEITGLTNDLQTYVFKNYAVINGSEDLEDLAFITIGGQCPLVEPNFGNNVTLTNRLNDSKVRATVKVQTEEAGAIEFIYDLRRNETRSIGCTGAHGAGGNDYKFKYEVVKCTRI